MVIENKLDTPLQKEDEELISEKLTEIRKYIRAKRSRKIRLDVLTKVSKDME